MRICPTCQRPYADELAFCPHDGTPLGASNTPLIGQTFEGRYEIEALIAQTRTGQLYRARHTLTDRPVALKIFRPQVRDEVAKWLSHFYREWEASLHFPDPNAVAIYNLRADCMVMEYVEGQTLDKELRERGRFTPREVFAVLEPVARALEALGSSGIYCDFLTPSDIMIRRAEYDLLIVKLLPLIFNRRAFERMLVLISTGVRLNTEAIAAPYVAPKLRGEDAPPADDSDVVYSLGMISYEMLSGLKLYDGLTAREIARKQAADQPAPLTELVPGMPASVARVIARALAKNEKERHATVGKFVSELRDALGMNEGAIGSPSGMVGAAERPVAVAGSSPTERSGSHVETKSGSVGAPSTDASVTDKPLYTDENVQFTVYQPEAVAPARWHTLLAFAHLSKRRPDAPPDEPEPLAEVKRLAERILADETADYDAVKQNSLHAVPHKGEITFVPDIDGCEFNPPRQSFSWQKSVHKVEFEMRAAASLDGRMARGRLTVFLGSLILADVPLAIRVDSAASASSAREVPTAPVSATPYRKIFPSYSHKDRAIVEQIEHHVRVLGDKYLRDVSELRAGQDWQRWMREAIEEADMFQLFWSHNSMHSAYVRQEWEYALSLGRPNFVRPTYWEVPLPENPAENLPPAELRQLHFQHLHANYNTDDAAQGGGDLAAGGRRRGSAQEIARSVGAVVCSSCGALNPMEKAFCQNCGGMLSAAASSQAQTAADSAQQPSSALDIFWEKRPRETVASPTYSLPSPKSYSQASPLATSGRTWLRFSLLFFIVLIIGVVVGIYLLVRFL